jgi:hypothetical protein
MSSPLVTQVDAPFLVIPAQPAQSALLAKPTTSWAEQMIAGKGGNTQSWLPSTTPIAAAGQSKQTLNMGGMTVDLLPTDDPATRLSIPSMVQGQANTQAATQAAISAQFAQQQPPLSSTGIQAALDAGKVDILGMGIFETPDTAFAFANTTIPSYALYGAVALAACVLVYYLHRENYV